MIPPLRAGVTDVRDRLEDCCRGIVEARDPTSRTRLVLAAEPLRIDARTAWMITAAAAELVANAERHAFGGGEGDVVVSLRQEGAHLTLSVCDDGRGAGTWTSEQGGSGGPIVDALADAMGATVERCSTEHGTVVEMTMPTPGFDRRGGTRRLTA